MDGRHGPPGQISQRGHSHGWSTKPAKRLKDKNRQIPTEEKGCVYVCVLSLLWRLSYTHIPGHPKGLGWVWLPWECLEALTFGRPGCAVR